ncbi:MAG TPA: SMC-Scp complex subunit ScpB [bacterium]|nr:SMC-Scp complex subunit ScpB [bacterium]
MEQERIKGILESVIFAAEKPVTMKELKEVFSEDESIEKEQIEEALEGLKADAGVESRGIVLSEVSGGWAFRTKPEYRGWVGKLTAPKAQRLTKAQLETLAIVAYRQPVTRAGIDDIRGVDSGAVLKVLLDKRLIKIIGRQEAVGNPLIYATTKEFLEIFGLRDLTGLPTLKEFQELDEDSRRELDANGIALDEPPSAEAVAASNEEGFERTGERISLAGADDAEDGRVSAASSGDEE